MALILSPPGNQEALPDKLADLGRTRKLTVLATGLFTWIAAIAGIIVLACGLDAAVHLAPLARGFALVSLLTVGGLLAIRGLFWPLSLRTDALSVALELEERYPAFNDALASAVTFLAMGDAELGVSNRLQRVVVRSAQRLVERQPFDRLIPSGACWRAGWLCAIVLAALIPLVLVNIERAGTALVRLVDPFGTHPWPTKTRIEILVPEKLPTRMPKGEPFTLKFTVRGVITDRAIVVFRMLGGEEFEENISLGDGNESRSSVIVSTQIDAGRLPNPFTFRIVANDCDTGWQSVDVVPPPRLVDLEGRPSPQFHVSPPAYTELLPSDLPDGAVVLEAPVGTIVTMRAAADLRLSSAQLVFLGERSVIEKVAGFAPLGNLNPFAAAAALCMAPDIGGDIPLELDGEGRILSGVFAPSMSGKYALKLNDETGLTGSRLLEIRLTPDPAPVVTLLHPAAGKDPTLLKPSATIPIQVLTDDKLYGLRRGFLEYRVGREGIVRTLSVFDLRTTAALPALTGGLGATFHNRQTTLEMNLQLPVSAFKRDDGTPPRAGDTLFLGGAADDWDDVSVGKQPGRSGEVEIQIAAADAIEAALQKELAALRPELIRLRDQEREGRQKTAEAIPQADGSLTPADRDKLLAAEQIQRQIRGKVSDPRDGLRTRAELLRQTSRANNLAKSNTTDRVEAVAEELGRLADRDFNAIEANLDDARQIGGQPPRPGQEQVVPEHLKKAARHQKAVEDGLTNLLDLLAVWGGAAEIRGEARLLRDQIGRQIEDGEKLSDKVPAGKVVETLTTQQSANLERAAGKAELAAEQAGSLLARAAHLAAEKDQQASASAGAAALKLLQSEAVRAKAETLPTGDPEKSALNAQANALKAEADALKAAADKSSSEAAALRKAIDAAGGQSLTEDLRNAANSLKKNQQANASDQQRSATARLERLNEALAEKPAEVAPDLAKLKPLANELNALADDQENLRKQASDAAKISDPAQRETELKRLTREQEKLIERGKDILQRLTRQQAENAARDTRAALDQMETARDDLEKGKPSPRSQDEATELLDQARDRLDRTTNNSTQQLSDEKRRKAADKIKALLERQIAAGAEADRIHAEMFKNKKWDRPLLTSYGDLEERERVLAGEVRLLSENEFAPLPVLARLLAEAATAMEGAAAQTVMRREVADPALAFDPELEKANDRKVKRPMLLATRRLQQLLSVLKEDPPPAAAKKAPPANPEPKNPANPGSGSGGGDQDLIPPLAQLKVLKTLQAELNQQTAEFAAQHPDKDKLTEEELAELKEIEQAQRDIATLFEQLAKLFQEQRQNNENPGNNDPEKSP
jgi:hypothetical protein